MIGWGTTQNFPDLHVYYPLQVWGVQPSWLFRSEVTQHLYYLNSVPSSDNETATLTLPRCNSSSSFWQTDFSFTSTMSTIAAAKGFKVSKIDYIRLFGVFWSLFYLSLALSLVYSITPATPTPTHPPPPPPSHPTCLDLLETFHASTPRT